MIQNLLFSKCIQSVYAIVWWEFFLEWKCLLSDSFIQIVLDLLSIHSVKLMGMTKDVKMCGVVL